MSAPRKDDAEAVHVGLARPPLAGGRARIPAVAMVAVLLAAGVLVAHVASPRPPRIRLQPIALASEASPVGSQSSSWYCPGAPGPGGPTVGMHLDLVNAGARDVRATIVVVDARGRSAVSRVVVPAHAQIGETPGRLVSGAWVAARVNVAGGGVTASELVDAGGRQSVAPCASERSATWYFASGSTAQGSSLRVALFNPSTDLAVVDLSFVTTSGITSPQPFQGLVIDPGAVSAVTVGRYVQHRSAVATVVSARSGTVVAGELQLYGPGGAAGVAIRLGSPAPSPVWDVPCAEDAVGGTSELAVFNPSSQTEQVKVDVRLASGPVAPFTQVVGPHSVWNLETGDALRIPAGVVYAMRVRTTGPGVVVARIGAGTPGSQTSQWADAIVVPSVATSTSLRWVVPAVRQPPGAQRAPLSVAVDNPGRRAVRVTLSWFSAPGVRRVRHVRVAGGSFSQLDGGPGPLVVAADAPVAVVGQSPLPGAGGAGVGLGVPAVAQA